MVLVLVIKIVIIYLPPVPMASWFMRVQCSHYFRTVVFCKANEMVAVKLDTVIITDRLDSGRVNKITQPPPMV